MTKRRGSSKATNALADAREWAGLINVLLAHGDLIGARDRADRAIECAVAALPGAKGDTAIALADIAWYADMGTLDRTALRGLAALAG
jgi:hypothetical protein